MIEKSSRILFLPLDDEKDVSPNARRLDHRTWAATFLGRCWQEYPEDVQDDNLALRSSD